MAVAEEDGLRACRAFAQDAVSRFRRIARETLLAGIAFPLPGLGFPGGVGAAAVGAGNGGVGRGHGGGMCGIGGETQLRREIIMTLNHATVLAAARAMRPQVACMAFEGRGTLASVCWIRGHHSRNAASSAGASASKTRPLRTISTVRSSGIRPLSEG